MNGHGHLHVFTQALMSAVPKPDPRHEVRSNPRKGDVADPANPPSGCYFHPCCTYAEDRCHKQMPELRKL